MCVRFIAAGSSSCKILLISECRGWRVLPSMVSKIRAYTSCSDGIRAYTSCSERGGGTRWWNLEHGIQLFDVCPTGTRVCLYIRKTGMPHTRRVCICVCVSKRRRRKGNVCERKVVSSARAHTKAWVTCAGYLLPV